MKPLTKTIAIMTSALALGFACKTAFGAEEELAMTDTYKNFESSKMFSVPTADVINSKDISLEMSVGSTDIMTCRGSLGLGNVAEISGSLGEIKKDFTGKGDMSSSASLKVKVFNNRGWVPGFALMLSKNLESEFKIDSADYKMTTTDLHALLKHGSSIGGHDFALNYGMRITASQYSNTDDTTYNTDYAFLPFVGFKILINESVTGMIEGEAVPAYVSKEGKPEMNENYVVQGGVRFFAKSWLAFNFGAKYTIDPNDTKETNSGLANAQIVGKMHLTIPTSLVWKRMSSAPRK